MTRNNSMLKRNFLNLNYKCHIPGVILIICSVSYVLFTKKRILQENEPNTRQYFVTRNIHEDVITNTTQDLSTKTCLKISELPEPFRQGKMMSYISLLGKGHPSYVSHLSNPCWFEELTTAFPYKGKYFYDHVYPAKHPPSIFHHLENTWKQRLKDGHTCRLRCLPKFYVAGISKCGTSDLFYMIRKHPQVVNSFHKEIHWWSRTRIGDNNELMKIEKQCDGSKWYCSFTRGYASPIEFYVDLFDKDALELEKPSGSQRIIGEASPDTMFFSVGWRKLPENGGQEVPHFFNAHYIRQVTPHARFIVILRNPASRLYAWYHAKLGSSAKHFHELCVKNIQKMKNCLTERTLWSCVNDVTLDNFFRLRVSMYYPFIHEWLKIFPREQFFFTRLEDYMQNRKGVLDDIGSFLEIGPFPNHLSKKLTTKVVMNSHKKDRGPMLNETKGLLDDFFRPYNEMLADLLKDKKYLFLDGH